MSIKKKLYSLISIIVSLVIVFSFTACKDNEHKAINANGGFEYSDIDDSEYNSDTDDDSNISPDSDEAEVTTPPVTTVTTTAKKPPVTKAPVTTKAPAAPAPKILYNYFSNFNIPESIANDASAIYSGMLNKKTSISLTGQINKDQISNLVYELRDVMPADCNPIANNFQYYLNGNNQIIKLNLYNANTAEQQNALSQQVEAIIGNMPNGSEREKIKYIHDYIINNCEYDQSLKKYTAYDCLVGKSCVCEGYSKAFHLLCTRAGINAICISGSAGGPHMWNMVMCDGKWYHIDVTFDDPIYVTPILRYDYFLKTDAQISTDHTISNYSFFSRPVA